jgi:3-oxoacyl-[acyl-carrier-protein] synthase-1
LGIVSSIGTGADEVARSLRDARSGVVFAEDYARLGFKCQVHAAPKIGDWTQLVDRRAARFLAAGTAYGHIAMEQAIASAGLEKADVSNERAGIIFGSGGPSTKAIVEAADITREKVSPKRIGPFAVPKAMSSGPSATLATWFEIKGVNYSISSACATSVHCIGAAAEQIMMGKQDLVFAGGTEELDWTLSDMFDAMGAMSTHFNETPAVASRAYDRDRDGFVIAGGAGVLVLEELEHAKARGAKIYAEIVGYGLSGDAFHITAPSPDGNGGFRSMRAALKRAQLNPEDIDYINAHGTSTPKGDEIELGAVKRLFGDAVYKLSMSSTKSATGHLLGAAGAVEAIFSLLTIRDNMVPPTLNLDNPSVNTGLDLVPHQAKAKTVDVALSNSFGFGGTNGSLVFRRLR